MIPLVNCTLYYFTRTIFVEVLFFNLLGMFEALLLLTTDFYLCSGLIVTKISFLFIHCTYNLIFVFKFLCWSLTNEGK